MAPTTADPAVLVNPVPPGVLMAPVPDVAAILAMSVDRVVPLQTFAVCIVAGRRALV